MQTIFDSGVLFAFPKLAQDQSPLTNQTPVKIGSLDSVALTMSKELELFTGQFQYPIRALNKVAKIEGKASTAKINGRLLNELYFGQNQSAGSLQMVVNFGVTLAGVTVTVVPPSGTFAYDAGVLQGLTGDELTRTTGVPAPNEYKVSAAGVYTFHPLMVGIAVKISYAYNATDGKSLNLIDPLIGLAPTFGILLYTKFDCKQATIYLPNCVSNSFGLTTRLETYSIPEFGFTVIADLDCSIGKFSFAD